MSASTVRTVDCQACQGRTDVVVEIPATDKVLEVCPGCAVALMIGMADRGMGSRFRLTPVTPPASCVLLERVFEAMS